jgi:murein DD-endopeptidase MepM/ murein hydrolase activator NlpD
MNKKVFLKKTIVLVLILMFVVTTGEATDFPVTSPFGWRNDPYTGEWKFHSGVDLGYEYGAAIPAIYDGVVVYAGDNNDGYGNCVLLYHPSIDAYTRYGHCSILYVYQGQQVQAGDVIALIGSTGRSTGPHLHLEYIVDTTDGYQYVNPMNLWGMA